MVTKDIRRMINTCLEYADNIATNPNSKYPANARLSLRNQLKDDMLTFFGFLYDHNSEEIEKQVEFINRNLGIIITVDNFKRFVMDRCKEEMFLTSIPQSLERRSASMPAEIETGVMIHSRTECLLEQE